MEVLGGDMRSARFRRSVAPRIAYMPQGLGRNLYAPLSVFDNVDFFGRLFDQPARERRRRIDALLASTGLEPFRDRQAGKLSGGMKQKLGLCCALLHDPDFLILDEPTTGIDPLSRRQFWQLLARIRSRRPAMSVLVSTAYMEEAESFDWLAAMDAGRLLASGTPHTLMASTGTRDLDAAFIELLPEARRRGHRAFAIPPRRAGDGEPAIEATRLTRRFGDFTAVDHVSFRIERGEIFGFLGSNGCGKTTTMKMLAGLLPATEGHARLFGRAVDPRDLDSRRRVGYMSQGFSLYGELTVRQNLELHARLFQLPANSVATHVAALLGRFDLDAHADALAEALPVGIRQRLSLAVAMVHEPEILILDEPTSGVDPVARDEFWELLIDLSRRRGVTIFVSTHFMNEGERCDRISLMHAGRVLATDAPASLVRARGAASLEEAFVSYLEEASGGPTPEAAVMPTPAEPRITPRRWFERGAPAGLCPAGEPGARPRSDPPHLRPAGLGAADGRARATASPWTSTTWPSRSSTATTAPRAVTTSTTSPAHAISSGDRRLGDRRRHRPASARGGSWRWRSRSRPGFGRDLTRGRAPEIGVWVDGAMPFRGETIRGYVQGVHQDYLARLSTAAEPRAGPAPTSRCATATTRISGASTRWCRHHRAAAPVRPGDPGRAGGGAREGARLDHQSLRDPGDPPGVPARQAAAVRGHRDGELRNPDDAGRVRVPRPDQGQPGRAHVRRRAVRRDHHRIRAPGLRVHPDARSPPCSARPSRRSRRPTSSPDSPIPSPRWRAPVASSARPSP